MTRKTSPRLFLLAPTLPLVGMMLSVGMAASSAPPKPGKTAPPTATAATFEHEALPLVQKYCISCHSGKEPSGGVLLTEDKTLANMLAHRDLWDRVAANVESKHMPPDGMPAPSAAERATFADYVQSTLSKADCAVKDAGRVTVRRLNRTEYDNTVRDLTGLDLHLSDDFPNDDVGYGFDNIGDVLSISPLLMEKYLTAAGKIAHAAIFASEDIVPLPTDGVKISADLLTGAGSSFKGDSLRLETEGEAGYDFDFPAPGRYRYRVTSYEEHAGADNAQMAIRFDGRTLQTVAVAARIAKPQAFDNSIDVATKGKHHISVAFLNDYYNTNSPDLKMRGDRNLVVKAVRIDPIDVPTPSAPDPTDVQRRLLPVMPVDRASAAAENVAARKDLTIFASRAFRRPATPAEIDRLMHIVDRVQKQGGSFERAMQYAIQGVLVSPNFLFRIEHDPDPTNTRVQHPVSDYELATRLSYFLWSTMPDERLLNLAAAKKLHNPAVLDAEARRMLHDPRAHALADNFAAQWLQLRKLQNVTPDPAKFPEWNEALRSAMRQETLLYFQGVVDNDRSVLDFLDSNYTYLNQPLARLYGNTEVTGDNFRRVQLRGDERGGVLTQASVLTVTSNPTRTSPVKRGKWVLENLLGINIPAPPPGVPVLADDKEGPVVGTLRQRMEQHRSNPACASCHQQMDPIGFGLENYNAIGKWRTMDGAAAIDAAGKLPGGGAEFHDPSQLRAGLKAKGPQFVHNLSEKMLTYALGRGVESYDRCNVDMIAKEVAQHGYRFSSLVDAIVLSDPFRYRRGDSGGGKPVRVGQQMGHQEGRPQLGER